jgi:hypothetical protein
MIEELFSKFRLAFKRDLVYWTKTRTCDLEQYFAQQDLIAAECASGRIDSYELKKRKADIQSRFKFIFSDCYTFSNFQALHNFFVNRMRMDDKLATEAVEHERQHYEAIPPVYRKGVKYKCHLNIDDLGNLCFQPFLEISLSAEGYRTDVLLGIVKGVDEKSPSDIALEKVLNQR